MHNILTTLSKREEATSGSIILIVKFWLSVSGGDDEDQDLAVCSPQYGPQVKLALSTMGEKDLSFELIEAILKYIASMNTPGKSIAGHRAQRAQSLCRVGRNSVDKFVYIS